MQTLIILCALAASNQLMQLGQVAAEKNFDFSFDAIHCDSSDPENYLTKLRCFTDKAKNHTFSVELLLRKDLDHFGLNLEVFLPRQPVEYKIFELNNVDGCQLLSNTNQVLFLQLGRLPLNRFGNMPKQCPFRKNILYYIHDFRIDMDIFRGFFFETKVHTRFDVIVDGNKIVSGFTEGHTYKI